MTYVLIISVAIVCSAGAWYLRARLAVRRGESTARAEREAAIRACSKRHREACAVFQLDANREWTNELEIQQLRKMEAAEKKAATKPRARAREDDDAGGHL